MLPGNSRSRMRSWTGRWGCIIAGVFLVGAGVGAAGARVASPLPLAPKPVPVLRTDLEGVPGEEVVITTTEWSPGQRLPLHMHPGGHEFAYVTEGEMTFEVEGHGATTVRAGQVHHVLPGVAHFGRNAGTVMAKTVVFRVKDRDQPMSVELKK